MAELEIFVRMCEFDSLLVVLYVHRLISLALSDLLSCVSEHRSTLLLSLCGSHTCFLSMNWVGKDLLLNEVNHTISSRPTWCFRWYAQSFLCIFFSSLGLFLCSALIVFVLWSSVFSRFALLCSFSVITSIRYWCLPLTRESAMHTRIDILSRLINYSTSTKKNEKNRHEKQNELSFLCS